jgi:hypothetical protein
LDIQLDDESSAAPHGEIIGSEDGAALPQDAGVSGRDYIVDIIAAQLTARANTLEGTRTENHLGSGGRCVHDKERRARQNL